MPTNLLSISTHQVAVVPHCTCCQNPMSLPIGIVSLIPQNAPNNHLADMNSKFDGNCHIGHQVNHVTNSSINTDLPKDALQASNFGPYPSNEENLQDQDVGVFHLCEKSEIS